MMKNVGEDLRLVSIGGLKAGGASRRRSGAAAVRAVAALACLGGLVACAPTGTATTPGARDAAAAAYRSSVEAGINLYEGGDFVLAAQRFGAAANYARAFGAPGLEKDAVAGECMGWLRARRLRELGECSRRLESLQRRGRRSDPGVNTLIAFGAIAGQRPLPALRIPSTVRPLVQASAGESR